MKKTWKYLLIYLLLFELAVPFCVSPGIAYHYRMNYAVIKDNPGNIDIVLEQIQKRIEKEHLKDYIILLGDSVAYSGPGPAEQSIGPDLEKYFLERGEKRVVFNLSLPAMQVGDIYTILLKLEEKGISTDHLVFNVIYAGFSERQPDPPIVFWLQEDLAQLSPADFERIKPDLAANQKLPPNTVPAKVNRLITNHLAMFRYRDFLKADLNRRIQQLQGNVVADTLGDNRPWYEKEGLKEMLAAPAYQKGYSTTAFNMDEKNPQIYFLNKIFAHQQGKETLAFLTPVNPALLEQVNDPAYQRNLSVVGDYFAKQSNVAFIDLHGQIDQRLFTDHVHLTAEGYQVMAQKLGDTLTGGAK